MQSASEYDDLTIDNVARWYVVHTYSGHEQKVKDNILKIVESRGMGDLILKINIPTEEKVEIKNGQRKSRKVKQFIGYILIKMKVTNESWYVVRNTQGVTGFVGQGKKPVPLTAEEVRRLGIEKVIVNLCHQLMIDQMDFAQLDGEPPSVTIWIWHDEDNADQAVPEPQ